MGLKHPLVPAAVVFLLSTIAGRIFAANEFALVGFCGGAAALAARNFSRKIWFVYAAIAFFSFARASYCSAEEKRNRNEFDLYCGKAEYLTVCGKIESLRGPYRINDGLDVYYFKMGPNSFYSKGGKKVQHRRIGAKIENRTKQFAIKNGIMVEATGRLKDDNGDMLFMTDSSKMIVKENIGIASKIFNAAKKAIISSVDGFHEGKSILLAMILGERDEIGKNLMNAFKSSGTMHIFAISGLHVGIISMMAVYILSFAGVSRKNVFYFITPFLFFYVYLTGMQPSAIRAAIMISVYFAAPVFGRKPDVFGSVAFTLIAVLLFNPLKLDEIGLVMSFAMVLGIILFMPRIQEILSFLSKDEESMAERRLAIVSERHGDAKIRARRWPRDLFILAKHRFISLFSVALCASLVSFPLTAYYFGLVCPYSVIANLMVVPLSFPAILFSIMAVVLFPVWPGAHALFGRIAVLFAWAMKTISENMSSLPYSRIEVEFGIIPVAACYAVLSLLLLYGKKEKAEYFDDE